MRRGRYLLGVVLLLAGCAGGGPPSPPLAEPMTEGPREYAWPALRWQSGTQLTYRLDTYTERKTGDDVETRNSERVIRLLARERTAQARVPVGLLLGDTEVAVLLFNEDGRFHDAVAMKPGAPPAVKQLIWGLSLTTQHFAGRAMAVNERFTMELPRDLVRLMIARPDSELAEVVVAKPMAEVVFTGYRRLAGRIVVGLRGTTPNLLRRAVQWDDGDGEPLQVDFLSTEWTDHLDATAGTLVSRYWVMTLGGAFGGQRFTRRSVSSLVLER